MAVEKTAMPMIFTDANPAKASIVFANASFLDLLDRPRHAVVGHALEDFFACETNEQAGYRSLQRALATGQEGEWKLPCRSTDGPRFWASVFASPIRDSQGELTHNFLSFSKLDDGGRAFVERRDELAALYDQAPGFIAILEGPSHIFTFTNAAYKKFVKVTNVIGQTVSDAFPTLAAQGFLQLLDKVYATGEAFVRRAVAHARDRDDGVGATGPVGEVHEVEEPSVVALGEIREPAFAIRLLELV
ncbi:MAG: PAS domain-containing protein, partial [Candidatus Binatia bacterium]